jgi:hypothetical protein
MLNIVMFRPEVLTDGIVLCKDEFLDASFSGYGWVPGLVNVYIGTWP